jgi:hypothetical protein
MARTYATPYQSTSNELFDRTTLQSSVVSLPSKISNIPSGATIVPPSKATSLIPSTSVTSSNLGIPGAPSNGHSIFHETTSATMFYPNAQFIEDRVKDVPGNDNRSILNAFLGEWTCIFSMHERDLISYKKGLGCPAVIVTERDKILKVQVSIFGMHHSVKKQQHMVGVELKAKGKDYLFSLPSLHTMESKNPTEAKLMISFPPEFFNTKLIEIGANKTTLVLTVPRVFQVNEIKVREEPNGW